jgi:hypothetical protein
MAGKVWGTMSSTSQGATTLAAVNGFLNISGSTGSVAAAAGGTYGATITPQANSTANVQYLTGVMPFLTLSSANGTSGQANVAYFRGMTPFVTGFGSNLVVQNAVGLHTYSGWAGTGVTSTSTAGARYAVLNEDQYTVIQTNGNVTVTGNTALGPYKETVSALGNSTGTVTIDYFLGTVKTLTATGNITINSANITNMQPGGSVTIIITQDATGSRILTSDMLFAGGSKTLSTAANAIDMINVFSPNGTTMYASLVKGFA